MLFVVYYYLYYYYYYLLQADKRKSKKTQKKTRRKTAQEQNTDWKHAVWPRNKKGSEPKKLRSTILKYMKNPTHLKMAM
jgi:hypothetical protein